MILLVDAAIRTLLLGSLVGLALFVCRVRRADPKLCVWKSVLAGALGLPIAGHLAIAYGLTAQIDLPVEIAAAKPGLQAAVQNAGTGRTKAGSLAQTAPELSTTSEPAPSSTADSAYAPPIETRQPTPAAVLVAAYVTLAALLLARVAAGWRRAVAVQRRGTPLSDPELRHRVETLARRAGIRQRVDVVDVPGLRVPATTGVVRPSILLPSAWREWDADLRDAVLIHELAHIAGRDALWQRLALVYRGVFWFSPFSWWLHRHLVELGEQASDEAVLDAGIESARYAEIVLGFLAAARLRTTGWQPAMANVRPSERRLDRILRWKRRPTMLKPPMPALVIAALPFAFGSAIVHASFTNVDGLPPISAPMRAPLLVDVPAAVEPAPPQVPRRRVQRIHMPVFPALEAPMTGVRLVHLVFDVTRLSAEELRTAVRMASAYLQRTGDRDSVAVSVSTAVGVQILQAPTYDRTVVATALDAVTSADRPADAPGELLSIGATCTDLRKRQQDSLARWEVGLIPHDRVPEKLVVMYFGGDDARETSQAGSGSGLAAICTSSNVELYAVDTMGRVAISQPRPLSPNMQAEVRELSRRMSEVLVDAPPHELAAILAATRERRPAIESLAGRWALTYDNASRGRWTLDVTLDEGGTISGYLTSAEGRAQAIRGRLVDGRIEFAPTATESDGWRSAFTAAPSDAGMLTGATLLYTAEGHDVSVATWTARRVR